MRKIIQLVYVPPKHATSSTWFVLCDDGSVWRQKWVEAKPVPGSIPIIVDPTYIAFWERDNTFDPIATKQ